MPYIRLISNDHPNHAEIETNFFIPDFGKYGLFTSPVEVFSKINNDNKFVPPYDDKVKWLNDNWNGIISSLSSIKQLSNEWVRMLIECPFEVLDLSEVDEGLDYAIKRAYHRYLDYAVYELMINGDKIPVKRNVRCYIVNNDGTTNKVIHKGIDSRDCIAASLAQLREQMAPLLRYMPIKISL